MAHYGIWYGPGSQTFGTHAPPRDYDSDEHGYDPIYSAGELFMDKVRFRRPNRPKDEPWWSDKPARVNKLMNPAKAVRRRRPKKDKSSIKPVNIGKMDKIGFRGESGCIGHKIDVTKVSTYGLKRRDSLSANLPDGSDKTTLSYLAGPEPDQDSLLFYNEEQAFMAGITVQANYDARKYPLCAPHDGTKGLSFNTFQNDFLTAIAIVDLKDLNEVYDLAECLLGIDEGGDVAPAGAAGPIPIGGGAAANRRRAKRLKLSYAHLYRHISDDSLQRLLAQFAFNDGREAWRIVVRECFEPVTELELEDLRRNVRTMTIMALTIGIATNSSSRAQDWSTTNIWRCMKPSLTTPTR